MLPCQRFDLRILAVTRRSRVAACAVRASLNKASLVVEQLTSVQTARGAPSSTAIITQNAFFVAAWLDHRLFALELDVQSSLSLLLNGKLLTGADPFFVAPEGNIQQMVGRPENANWQDQKVNGIPASNK